MDKNRWILTIFTAIYLILSIYKAFFQKLSWIDNLIASVICLSFILQKKIKLNSFTAILIGSVFLPHGIGVLGGYGSPIWGYNFDKIVHVTSAFIGSMLMYSLIPLKKNFLKALIAIMVVLSIGTVIEVGEYWGFIVFGEGEGYLGFGEGDTSQNFGPWEDSNLDLTFNIIGAIIGIITYNLFRKIKLFYMKINRD